MYFICRETYIYKQCHRLRSRFPVFVLTGFSVDSSNSTMTSITCNNDEPIFDLTQLGFLWSWNVCIKCPLNKKKSSLITKNMNILWTLNRQNILQSTKLRTYMYIMECNLVNRAWLAIRLHLHVSICTLFIHALHTQLRKNWMLWIAKKNRKKERKKERGSYKLRLVHLFVSNFRCIN